MDWWALGILIYEMFAGFPPFYDENPVGIYKKILSGRIEFSKVFGKEVKDLVKKFLQADIQKRYGIGGKGIESVKKHRWFRGVDWTLVLRKGIPPPWVPEIRSQDDTHFFDNYPDSVDFVPPPPPDVNSLFKDF